MRIVCFVTEFGTSRNPSGVGVQCWWHKLSSYKFTQRGANALFIGAAAMSGPSGCAAAAEKGITVALPPLVIVHTVVMGSVWLSSPGVHKFNKACCDYGCCLDDLMNS